MQVKLQTVCHDSLSLHKPLIPVLTLGIDIVNATWMDRVETVVDWSLSKGFWVVLNVHHDSWQWADFTIEPETLEERKTKFEKLWVQIADRFKSKSEKLILEPLNEPAGSSSQENAEQ